MITVCVVIVATFAFSGFASAAPSALKTVYVTNDRVDLSWTADPSETYKVWMSTDGKLWDNIYTFRDKGESSYSVVYGITPYINYYFNITTKSVSYYPTDSTTSNSAYEVDAFPPNQNAHGYYSANTALCKNCHNTHTATGPKLLSFATVNDTCMSCHDGTGSKYDVINGKIYTSANKSTAGNSPAGSFGGKVFGKAAIANEPESIHTMGAVINTAPGGNPNGTGPWAETLGCGSCHDAHGSTNYRMLKSVLPFSNAIITVKAYAYTTSSGEAVNYISGMNNFCMGCHPAYNAPSDSSVNKYGVDFGETVSGDSYRHSMGITPSSYTRGGIPQPLTTSLPLEGTDPVTNNNKIMCATCHTAHGSTQPSVYTDAYDNDGPSNVSNYLLRKENMGVCEDCHKL